MSLQKQTLTNMTEATSTMGQLAACLSIFEFFMPCMKVINSKGAVLPCTIPGQLQASTLDLSTELYQTAMLMWFPPYTHYIKNVECIATCNNCL